jgi:hypothetical protein
VNPFTKLYVAAVIGLGAFALTSFTPDDIPSPMLAATWLAAMVVVSLFKLRLPLQRGHATMSMAYVIDFVVLATAGAELAMIVAAAGVLVQCTVRVRRAQPWYRTAFSIATVVLAVKTAGLLWSGLGGTVSDPGLTTTAIPLTLAAIAYFAVNTGLVLAAIALAHGAGSRRVSAYFVRTAPAFLIAAGAAIVMQILVSREAYLFVPGAITPVFVCYFAYAAWFQRIADSEHATVPALLT